MTGWEVVTWVLVSCSVTLNVIIWQRQRRINHAIANPRCVGHQLGDTVTFTHDDGTAFRLKVGDRPEENGVGDAIATSLSAYTERTDQPPQPGVCECYRDFTGLRLPLRRPCPVHGTTTETRDRPEETP